MFNQQTIVIIGLIVIIWLYYTTRDKYDLEGFWNPSEDFLKDSSLKNLYLYINKPKSKILFNNKYDGYLYMTNDEHVIEDQKIEIETRYLPYKLDGLWYNVKISNSDVWKNDLYFRICPKKNLLTIIDKEENTILAEVYKNNILTDYGINTPE